MKDFLIKFFNKYSNYIIGCIVFNVVFIFFNLSVIKYTQQNIQEVSYTEFQEYLKDGAIDTIYYNKNDEYMKFTLYNNETKNLTKAERADYKYDDMYYRRVLCPHYDEFRKEMLEAGVNLEVDDEGEMWLGLITQVLTLSIPVIIIMVLFNFMTRGMIQGVNKTDVLQTSDVTFDNVIGQEEILEDIKFIVELIKNPKIGKRIGAKTPKGILMTGDPGTGKTLIAKAIAGEAGVPFISMSGSDFKELYVGLGAKRVRDMFKIAREHAPCIIFIDEIDAIGAKRSGFQTNSEDNQTINALLKEMDGFSGREGIFILAATNHPEKLDSALKRAGRFDRQIAVNPPRDWKVRKQLLDYYLKKYTVDETVDTENLAKQLAGFTGADISMICNEASIIATMKEFDAIDSDCMEEAIDKKLFNGNRSKKEVFKKDKEIVAYHEAGHAVVTYLLSHPISRASIIASTSGVGGFVMQAETEDKLKSRKYYREQVMICYGGRASEQIKFNEITTGASNDITQATNILSGYVEGFGFDNEFGLLDMSVLQEQRFLEGDVVIEKLRKLSKELYEDTLKLLKSNYFLVESLAQKLLDVETLTGNEVEALLKETEDKNA